MIPKMTPQEQLTSLKGYQENLCEKHQIGYPSYLQTKKPSQQALKEVKKVTTRIKELSNCKRHGGVEGLDCFLCEMEGKFS